MVWNQQIHSFTIVELKHDLDQHLLERHLFSEGKMGVLYMYILFLTRDFTNVFTLIWEVPFIYEGLHCKINSLSVPHHCWKWVKTA